MDFAYDDRTRALAERLQTFLVEHVYPAEAVLHEQVQRARGTDREWSRPAVVTELKAAARAQGLWNLFIPGEHGAGLTNAQYAPLAELTGRSPWLAPEALNCAAPDTGNMEVLAEFGTPEQQSQWLEPLLDGRIRSAFCMTEPDVASSDATNIETRIRRDGDEYVVSGRKWWSTGAMDPAAEIFVVMGQSADPADDSVHRHRRQSMILVPRDAEGVRVVRALHTFGYDDAPHGGHAEVAFDDVRVPAANILKGEGEGFAIAQARLGPGRIHHCMRLIGMAERALELMCRRANEREAFGRPLAQQGVVREQVANARVAIEQARLLVLKTAWLMDTVGNKGAHAEIQAIKIAVPLMAQRVIDDAIQVHGGAGVSQDTPLAELWVAARTLRLADGPDEVHRMSLARRELARYS
ncbi:acyl-CoA dehydrogenase family protein [Angustibacter luteus]|uniref:Acyl-CoA dehydrogenase family protein n=1 Tax=Angustibacter luteus TaxID=658456 RepID=A0ABW1JJG6_9ACTN